MLEGSARVAAAAAAAAAETLDQRPRKRAFLFQVSAEAKMRDGAYAVSFVEPDVEIRSL